MAVILARAQVLFVHIPYCGGAIVKAAIDPHLRVGDVSLGFSPLGDTLQIGYQKRFGLGAFSTLKQVQAVMVDEFSQYTSVALVCDPELRIQQIHAAVMSDLHTHADRTGLSLEECKSELREERGPHALLSRAPVRAVVAARDDDDFVARLIMLSARVDGVSSLSYAHWLKGADGEEVDRVFRTEQLDHLRLYLESVLGRPLAMPIPAAPTILADSSEKLVLSPISRTRLREVLAYDYDLCQRFPVSSVLSESVGSFQF